MKTLLELDVPSGELIVGSHLEALAPLAPGQGRYSLNTAQGQALQAQAQAKSHLIEIYLGDNAVQMAEEVSTGRLRLLNYGAKLPRGFTPLTRTWLRQVLHLMDGADYDAQVQALGATGTVHERLLVEPGRYRFLVDFDGLFSFKDAIPNRFAWFDAKKVGPAQPIVRTTPPTSPAQPKDITETAMAAFLMAYIPRLQPLFPHPAQSIVEILTGYGAGLRWHRGQLTDQAIPKADPPAGEPGLTPVELPDGLVIPTFPALAVLGSASVDQVLAEGNIRSPILEAPVDADIHWLVLGLIVLASIQAAPEVIAGSDPSQDEQAREQVTRGFRQVCAQIDRAGRWDEVRASLVLMEPLVDLLRMPAPRFSARRAALAQFREQAAKAAPTAARDRARRRQP